MNRRRFLSMLGLAAAGAAIPAVLPEFLHPETDAEYYRRKRLESGPAGWVSYRFHMTVTMPPNCSTRIRYIDCVKPIASNQLHEMDSDRIKQSKDGIHSF